jgi:DNA-binding IclR family transcriptional regulator
MPRIGGEPGGEGVQAVILTLRILEYLAGQRKAVGVTALAQALGENKSRIYRHLRTLVQQGYIVQSADTERYRVGSRLVTLGRMVGESFDLANAAYDAIRELRDALGHSCVVSQVEAEGVRVLTTVPGKSPIEIGVKRGSLLPFHGSAQGKVALAFGDQDVRDAVLASQLEKLTPKTIVTQDALRKELGMVRHQGWAVAPNEALIGLNTLAAPIFDESGTIAGAVAIVDSIQFIPAEPSSEQVEQTLAAARHISEKLGYTDQDNGPSLMRSHGEHSMTKNLGSSPRTSFGTR